MSHAKKYSLEREIAEIEVLAKELDSRFNQDFQLASGTNPTDYLIEVYNEARVIADSGRKAKRAMKRKDDASVKRYCGDFALATKNLADNCNRLVQSLYAESPVNLEEDKNLRKIEANSKAAPKTRDGRTIYQISVRVHDLSGNSLTLNSRNQRGHGRTFNSDISRCNITPSGYLLNASEIESGREIDAGYWLDSQAQAYSSLAKTILETIVEGDKERFNSKKTFRGLRTKFKQIGNFYGRHSRPIAIALGSVILTAGLVGGSIGTLAYQSYLAKKGLEDKMKKVNFVIDRKNNFVRTWDLWEGVATADYEKDIKENRRYELQKILMDYPELAFRYHLDTIFKGDSNLFNQAISNLEQETETLGKPIENYLSMRKIELGYKVNINVQGGSWNSMTAEFIARREDLRASLRNFSASCFGKIPDEKALEQLKALNKEIQALSKLENRITTALPRMR